MNNKSDGNIN